MKKQILLLAGSAILLASCGSEEKKSEGPTQAQIDSTVNAQVAERAAAEKAKNDSIVAAAAQVTADSIAKAQEEEAAAKSKKTTTKTKTKTTTKTETKTPPPPPPPPANPKENRFKEEGEKKVDPANTKRKEDRFK